MTVFHWQDLGYVAFLPVFDFLPIVGTQKHVVGNMEPFKMKCRKFKPLGNVDVPLSYERALALTSVLLCSITTHDWKTGFAHKSVSRHLIVFQPGLHPNRSCLKYKENLHQAIAC